MRAPRVEPGSGNYLTDPAIISDQVHFDCPTTSERSGRFFSFLSLFLVLLWLGIVLIVGQE